MYLEYGLDTENKNVKLVLNAKDQQLNIAQLPVFEPLALPDYDRVPRTQEATAMQWKLHKVGELKFPKGNYPLSLQTTVMGGTQSIELKSIRLNQKK